MAEVMTQNTGWTGMGQLNNTSSNGAGKFPDPFFDIASTYVPNDLKQIFELMEFVYLTFGTYRSAARKVVRYFLTEIVVTGESEKEQEEFKTFITKELHLLNQLADIGDEYMVYGNCFVSLYFPFDRYLVCPKCHTEYVIDTIPYTFDARKAEFKCTCKHKECKHTGVFKRVDRRSMDRSRIRLKRWNPKLMRLRYHEISGDIEYYMELEPNFVKNIKEGKPFYLNKCPWEIIKCITDTEEGKTPLVRFNKGSLYHLKESTLMGLPIKGWSIPPLMANFKLIYYIQILRRYDEAIAYDFIVPFRVIFPEQAPNAQGLDALQSTSMAIFAGHMQNIIKEHRKDPTNIHSVPFQLGYQMIGGEGAKLAPKESIALAMDELLNAVGFPAELYKGTLQIQAFPVALRLFEKTWGNMVDGFDDLIAWVTKHVTSYYGWGTIEGALRSVTLADDLERKALSLQAAAGMDISKGTAYMPLGIDYMDEQRKVVEEQKKIMELQQEAMEAQQVAQMGDETGGTADVGGAQGGGVGATPGAVYEQGKQMAYQLVTQTPENLRRGELIKIKHSNPTLHAIVIQIMDDLRQEMARQGQAVMLEQAKQAEAGNTTKLAAWDEDAKSLPSPLRLSLLIADQVMDYRKKDLMKIAMDIKRGIIGADKAFSFVWRSQMGLD